ncbi:MAG TPA: hypothetical protein VN714_14795 [Trebonia sp.]|nr:hypothetical protein [Trebonia sp.]
MSSQVGEPVNSPPDEFPARPRLRARLWRVARWFLLAVVALIAALTVASFSYNAATGGPAARPAGLLMA